MPKSRFIRIKCWQERNISAVNKVHCNLIVKSIKSLKIDYILQGNDEFKGNKKSLVAENVSPTQLTVTDLDPLFSRVPTKKCLWVSYLSLCVFSHVNCHTAFLVPHRHPINRIRKYIQFYFLRLLLGPKLTEYYHFCRLLQIGTVALGRKVLRL